MYIKKLQLNIMESLQKFRPVVRNKRTNDLYWYNGGNSFTNIRTGKSGEVTDEAAKQTFNMNVEATYLINEYPMIAELINRLKLVIENKK